MRKKDELINKAYSKGRLTNDEALYVLINMFLKEDEYVLDTGDNEMVNAEIVLRLKGKEKQLHKIFWR